MTHAVFPAGIPTHTLHPGDVRCALRGERLVTLLGSCVAVVLTDPRRTVGAMCHIVHAPGGDLTRRGSSAAWGDLALETMQRQLLGRGIQPRMCEAYVFGGGNMFPQLYEGPHVGQGNAAWTLGALAGAGIRVISQDLGGAAYRRLSWTVGPEAPVVEAIPI